MHYPSSSPMLLKQLTLTPAAYFSTKNAKKITQAAATLQPLNGAVIADCG